MARGASRRTGIVADRRPLERGLARFLLEERGLFVVGEAATMADVLLQVQQLKPDIVILHEKLALDHDPTVIAQIRRISSRTSVVLLTANREALPPELLLLVDSVVEDGPGLTELGTAVAGPLPETGAAEEDAAAARVAAVVPPARRSASRWADRLQGLVAASIIALAFVIARGMTTPTLVPTVVGRAHLNAAWDSLGELQSALPNATSEQIAEIASALIDDRAAAEAAGVNLTTFDKALLQTLAAIWPTLSPETQVLLAALFGDIIDGNDVPAPMTAPPPEPSPSPPPAPEPRPTPSETPVVTETTTPPTETTTPPTETTTPPTETTTPPTETTTPPTETTTPPTETTTPPTETTTPPTETTTPPTETTTPPTETTTPPTETTTPPTETTTPPTETTTPPTETTTPPTETTTPPTETTTPPTMDGQTESGSLVVIPFTLTLLLAMSGWARRRSHETTEDPDESHPA